MFVVAGALAAFGFRVNPTFGATWDVPWAVAAGIAAGRAFWSFDRPSRGRVLLPLALWTSSFAIGLVRDRTFICGPALWEVSVVAIATLALYATIRPSHWNVVVLVVVALTIAAAQSLVPPAQGVPLVRRFDAALGAGALLAASLAARRRGVLAVVAGVLTLQLCWYVRNSDACRITGYSILHPMTLDDFVAEGVLLTAAYVGGATTKSVPSEAHCDRGDRAVIAIQRHPWIASMAVALVIVGGASLWTDLTRFHAPLWRAFDFVDDRTPLTFLLVGFSFLAYIGRRGSRFDRIAPWFAANAIVLPLSWVSLAEMYRDFNSGPSWTTGVVMATLAAVLPVAAGSVARAAGEFRFAGALAIATSTLVVVITVVAPAAYADSGVGGAIGSTVLLMVAFHAAVRTDLRSDLMVFVATAFGTAWGIGRIAAYGGLHHANYRGFAVDPFVGLIGGLLIVAARRLDGTTVLPRDHAVLKDFGRTETRAMRSVGEAAVR